MTKDRLAQTKIDEARFAVDSLRNELKEYASLSAAKSEIEQKLQEKKNVILNMLKDLGIVSIGKNFETSIDDKSITVYMYNKPVVIDPEKFFEFVKEKNLEISKFTTPSLWAPLKEAKRNNDYAAIIGELEDRGIAKEEEVGVITVHGKNDDLKKIGRHS